MDFWAEVLSVVIFPSFEDWERLEIFVCLFFFFSFSLPFHWYLSVEDDSLPLCLFWTQSTISSKMGVVSWVELLDFLSYLFWDDSPCSGAVLSNRTSCNVSLLCICLRIEVTINHVTSGTKETFPRYTLCTVKIMHLQFSGLHWWIVQPLTTVWVSSISALQKPRTTLYLLSSLNLWQPPIYFLVLQSPLVDCDGNKTLTCFLCARPPSSSIICLRFIHVWGCSILEWETGNS